MKFLKIIFKNVRRNLLRTTLTALGTMVLVFVVTLVWSVLYFLDAVTSEKANNLKAIVTEKWQIPSQMPFTYASRLAEGGARDPGDVKPADSMTWQFFVGTIDPDNRSFENIVFFYVLEPKKLRTMMEELDTLSPERARPLEESIKKMEENRRGVIVGSTRLKKLNKRIGERFTVYGTNFKDINLEVEIVGTFPDGTRYDQGSAMNRDYFNAALDAYERDHKGKKHALADRSLGLVWLRVPDKEQFGKVANQVVNSPDFSNPAVKCETASSGISTFLDAFKDLIWGMRWLLAPAILATLSLVIANAISISVRERRMEIAVLKVLGFLPSHILIIILGEALLIGATAGLLSSGLTYVIVNKVVGGVKFPLAFFGAFFIPGAAVGWGFAVGTLTAFLGSIVPAWSARSVRVADVFSKVA